MKKLLIALLLTTTAFAATDKVIVRKSVRSNIATVIDVGHAVRLSDGTDVAGMHGMVLVCNNDNPTCYRPFAGARGYITNGPQIYDGDNITIHWGPYGPYSDADTGTYAIREDY